MIRRVLIALAVLYVAFLLAGLMAAVIGLAVRQIACSGPREGVS